MSLLVPIDCTKYALKKRGASQREKGRGRGSEGQENRRQR